MARGTTLANLRVMLKAALGKTSGTALDTTYNQLLSDKQKWLADEFEWPFLEGPFDLPVPQNSRYLSFPTVDNEGNTSALNLEWPLTAEIYWSQIYTPLMYGVGSEQFNVLNSDLPGQYQDPIENWRWSESGQIEIWPMNATAQVIRFTGQRTLDTLVADTDTADLDDQIIVYAVAAELLARAKQADAGAKQQLFLERFRAIRAHYPTKQNGLVFGGDKLTFGRNSRRDDNIKLVAIAGNK